MVTSTQRSPALARAGKLISAEGIHDANKRDTVWATSKSQ